MLFTLASCAALLSLAAIPKARAADIPVIVGGAGVLAYNPPSVNAQVGDRVIFTFREKNHTATQSSLAAPCAPNGGFDSGFVPVDAGDVSGSKTAVYTVTSPDAVWVYCRQGTHCQAGMVFAINPGDKLAEFQANAKGGAAAPSATSGAPPASSSPALSNNHQVTVGGPGKLVFSPSNITAKAGDTITFTFQQKNHTVTQSNFANPCKSLSSSGQPGFDSGFRPVADGVTTGFPTWTLQVNDTQPIWAFCAQGNHCTSGMVFAVNTVESGPNTFEAFKNKATGASATGAASPSGTAKSGAIKTSSGAGFAGVFVAMVFALYL